MTVNFLSINTLSTIPVLRFILRDFAERYSVKVVHCKIETQPLNAGNKVLENEIGNFRSSKDFNRQRLLFKAMKYIKIYWKCISICLRKNQIIITQDFQVVSFLLTNNYLLSVYNTKLIYFQFELVDYELLSARDKLKILNIKVKSKFLDLCIFSEQNRLAYFCDTIGFSRERTMLFPNTCEVPLSISSEIPQFLKRIPPNAIVFGHIGNVGVDHFLNEFLDAAKSMSDNKNVFFVMVGRQSTEVNSSINAFDGKNFVALGEVPHAMLSEIYPFIHYGLILYKGVDKNFEFCAPNKLYEYWSYGIPVVAHQLKGLTPIINQPILGKVLNFERGELIPYLQELARQPSPNRERLRSYFEKHLSIRGYLEELHNRIESL